MVARPISDITEPVAVKIVQCFSYDLGFLACGNLNCRFSIADCKLKR